LAAVVVQGLVLRALLVERRRLQGRRTQELLAAARSGSGDATAAAPAAALDPGALARQTQTMVRWLVAILAAVAVFQIWVDVLPALGVLRRVTLWSTTGADGQSVPVTLADALASVFVVLAAAAAARNLPALLELFVLQRLRMQQGERHAVTTLARYFIVGIGIVLAFSAIGVGWSKVQWLVAAISVGLGFGLQEIFANFVSGLILLVERPIRVGDIVQIGETTGRVTQIRIRATTVMDWERKELIVPNREFVTGHFVNWTLTDGIVRRSIKLGVAYGSDTGKALQLLMECAGRSPAVLVDPRPEALFTGFGDSTLDLELRIFVDQNALDMKQISALLADIDATFRAAGLELAFPQRDVNIDLSERTVALLRQWR
jgi:potassium efflux system protein